MSAHAIGLGWVRKMKDDERLFPGSLAAIYSAFAAAVAAEGDAVAEFKKSQVSYGTDRNSPGSSR